MNLKESIDTYLGNVRFNPHCRAALNGLQDYVAAHDLDWLSLSMEQCQDVMSAYRSSEEFYSPPHINM